MKKFPLIIMHTLSVLVFFYFLFFSTTKIKIRSKNTLSLFIFFLFLSCEGTGGLAAHDDWWKLRLSHRCCTCLWSQQQNTHSTHNRWIKLKSSWRKMIGFDNKSFCFLGEIRNPFRTLLHLQLEVGPLMWFYTNVSIRSLIGGSPTQL